MSSARYYTTTLLALALLLLFFAFASPVLPTASAAREYVFTGKTMGTYYRIKLVSSKNLKKPLWQKKIDIRLKEVNERLSMYQKTSELSRFNMTQANSPFRVSRDFYRVLVQCQELYTLTDGAWDGTVKPLVDLWGFGTKHRNKTLPSQADIQNALSRTGFNKLLLDDQNLTKTASGITLDLGSIAKGYGVDEIARLIAESGVENYLVEIGGELVGSGKNKRGKTWTVGISKPKKGSVNPGLYKAVILENKAIATSGNYRNFFEKDGRLYSHIIHPKTGHPVDNMVVSATVIAPNCTRADGLATALMVMDTDKALDLVNSLEHTESLILKQEGQALRAFRSNGFSEYEMDL